MVFDVAIGKPAFGVHFGNFFYFLAIFVLFVGTLGLTLLCRRLGKKFAKKLILTLLWLNFALHFAKQLLPSYISRWPVGLTDSAAPNLCAVLIMIAPFVFLFGNAYWKDYLYYIGMVSGILVYFVPTGAMRYDAYPQGFGDPEYFTEVLRFYFCHFPLVACSFLMVEQGFHKLDYHRLWALPLMFGIVLAIVALNSFFFGPILKVEGFPHEILGPDGLLNRMGPHSEIANQSMAFGPQPNMDKALSWIYPFLIPGLMTFVIDGQLYFTPVIWIVPFVYIGTLVLGPLFSAPFEGRHMALDLSAFLQKRKLQKMERNARPK